MNWWSALVALVAALIGATAAVGATWWSLNRAAQAAFREAQAREAEALKALMFEVDVARSIAANGSVAELPTVLLLSAASALGALPPEAKAAVVTYAEAVHRYNGRAHRLVLYGAAKRVRGEDPGAEKVKPEHVDPVMIRSDAAKAALGAHLQRHGD